MSDEHVYDVGVVGAGYGGLSSAVWLRRHRLDTLVFDGGPARNVMAAEVHGYLGMTNMSASEILAMGRRHARETGARIISARITHAQRTSVADEAAGDPESAQTAFLLTTHEGAQYRVRRLVLATGVHDRLPNIEGVDAFFGRSLHICPHCDAFEWRGARIAVIGWAPSTPAFALKVSYWSPHVVLVSDGHPLNLDPDTHAVLNEHGIEVIEERIAKLQGENGHLRALRLANDEAIAINAAFSDLGQDYHTDLAVQLGCRLIDSGAIMVDAEQHTSVPGVWAVGDVAGDAQFVAIAVAHGVKAGVDVYRTFAATDPERKAP